MPPCPRPSTALVADLAAGASEVVDLTQSLGPSTPVIALPPMFGASPAYSEEVISRYDEQGPGWYWKTIHLGEHTGTHFDAPVHWITGKDLPDNATDTIPAGALRRAGLRHRRRAPSAPSTRTSCSTPEYILAWEATPRPDSGRRLGAAAHRLAPPH